MIRLTKPELGGAVDDIKTVLETGFLVQGKKVRQFETLVAAYVGRKHGVAVNSGTSAIQCGLLSLGIGKGDDVIVPDFTFPATANAVVSCGATLVPADIDLSTFNLDVHSFEAGLTSRTRAVMPVDLFGLAADMEPIEDICRQHGLILIEDSACALGARYHDTRCGSFGKVSLLSFHPRKVVTTGEGGMVLTDDDEIAESVRRLRNHGIQISEGRTDFVLAGYNMRMNEIEACLGIAQMRQIDDMIDRRRRIASLYDELLGDMEELEPPVAPEGYFHTYQSYVVMLDERINRQVLMASMMDKGVETAIGTYSVHAQSFYRKTLGLEPGSVPQSYRAFNQSLALPIYASMGEEAARSVADTLKECIPGAATGK